MAQFQRKAESKTRRRVWVLAVCFGILAFAAVAVRLFQLQVFDHEFYEAQAASLQTRDKVIYPTRGTIYDCNGKPLAISADTEMVTLEAVKIDSDEQGLLIAQKLSEILGLDYDDVLAKVQKRASYAVIKRGVEKDVADQIRAFVKENKLDSVFLSADSTRYYPYGNFLSNVLGFVGSDEQGLGGLEIQYEDELAGTPGRIVTATNAKGEEMPFEYEMYYEPEEGHSLILTIDEVLQHYLEKNLEVAYKDNNVQVGTMGIVMDVNTGGILAMACYPDFDPNTPFTLTDQEAAAEIAAMTDSDAQKKARSDALYAQWNNKTISYTYYPGSTFKIITASSALEEGVINLDSTFTCTGHITVGGRSIACWRYYNPHGTQTLSQAIQNSCNPAFVQIGLRLGAEKFSKYVSAFGLREKTGIDLPGEAVGLFNLNQEIDLAVYSFGQNFTITPLQLITAVSAVANGGTLLQPHVVKEIVDSEGNLIQSFDRTEVRQVISKQTSETMAQLLEGVVKVGTGKNAYTAGYRVAGKTGTTENIAKEQAAAKQGISAQYRISSFIAFAPADNPQIAVLIVLDEPTVAPVTGGITVAPVIRRFMEEAMPYLNVNPVYTEDELQEKDVTVPDVIGLSYSEAENKLQGVGLQVRTEGEGSTVTDQLPRAGTQISGKSKAVLYLGGAAPQKTVVVPDLSGLSLDEATTQLQSRGLYIRVSGGAAYSDTGNIVVTKQDVDPETELSYGGVVTVEVSDLSQRSE
ncbi:MAG: penicillin-binding transpeptidase domain-containing protein [Clostridiaceae bacterium]|nr:penicillin-binding transpeptidase domain-containing protein [Clostridiaceae bacterium]